MRNLYTLLPNKHERQAWNVRRMELLEEKRRVWRFQLNKLPTYRRISREFEFQRQAEFEALHEIKQR